MRRTLIFTLVLTISISLNVMFFPCQSEARDLARVSVDENGNEYTGGQEAEPADNGSRYSSISPDGRWVAFASNNSNLVAGVTDTYWDVYLKDTETGEIVLVSKSTGGTGGNEDSQDPSISDDGRYVAFESDASDLLPAGEDNNDEWDIFVYDRTTDTIVRISEAAAGGDSNEQSRDPVITTVNNPDGLYVAFESLATDLVAPATTANRKNVFVYDSNAVGGNGIELVSMDSSGVEGNDISCDPSISSDGQYVAFASEATNFFNPPVTTANRYNVYLKDTDTGAITLLSQNGSNEEGDNDSEYPSISADGSIVAFESEATNLDPDLLTPDTNGQADVFVWVSGTGLERVSKNSAGVEGGHRSKDASISGDGRYVAFESRATNLVPDDNNGEHDVFVKDINTDAIQLISVDNSGGQGNNDSYNASISYDGSYVAFESKATNLVSNDTNAVRDVFVSSPSSSSPGGGSGGSSGGCFINTCSMF